MAPDEITPALGGGGRRRPTTPTRRRRHERRLWSVERGRCQSWQRETLRAEAGTSVRVVVRTIEKAGEYASVCGSVGCGTVSSARVYTSGSCCALFELALPSSVGSGMCLYPRGADCSSHLHALQATHCRSGSGSQCVVCQLRRRRRRGRGSDAGRQNSLEQRKGIRSTYTLARLSYLWIAV